VARENVNQDRRLRLNSATPLGMNDRTLHARGYGEEPVGDAVVLSQYLSREDPKFLGKEISLGPAVEESSLHSGHGLVRRGESCADPSELTRRLDPTSILKEKAIRAKRDTPCGKIVRGLERKVCGDASLGYAEVRASSQEASPCSVTHERLIHQGFALSKLIKCGYVESFQRTHLIKVEASCTSAGESGSP
jgi:hypothetical protein